MSTKSKSRQEEAMQLLDELEIPDVSDVSASSHIPAQARAPGNDGEAEALAFIDEITQKSSEPTKTTLDRPISRSGTPVRKSTERVRLGGGNSGLSSGPSPITSKPAVAPATATDTPRSSTWGWGSVWSTASAALQQAKSAVDEQVKHLPQTEQAQKWTEGIIEYAKSTQLDKLSQDVRRVGLSTLTDILNVVAPPISEHEVIQVWLSHDMVGYDGIESLIYRSLARIMGQVKGGDLVVNRGQESKPKDGANARELNTVIGFDEAIKLSKANLEELTKTKAVEPEKATSTHDPVTYSNVYFRIQPFLFSQDSPDTGQHFQFLLYFVDPSHNLTHSTRTQAISAKWLDMWDEHEWVEDVVAEILRVGVEVVGQEYIVSRMGWYQNGSETKNAEEVLADHENEKTTET